MTFIRPKTPSRPEKDRSWVTMLGAADDRDGRALDALARSLRLISLSWVTIMAARTAMMTIFVGFAHAPAMLHDAVFMALLGTATLADLLIVSAPFIERIEGHAPNRRLFTLAPLVLLSSGVFELGVIETVGSNPAALLPVTLGPALLAMVIFGRQRLLSLAYVGGALAAQLAALPLLSLAIPLLVFTLGVLLVMVIEWRISRKFASFMAFSNHVLSGEQAKALLVDFERSGHGWFWETDRSGAISYISETLAGQMGRTLSDVMGMPFSALIATPQRASDLEGQRTVGFHFSARTAFSDIAVLAAHAADERWWSISGHPIITPFGQFLGFRGSGADLTEMRRSQAEVARLASVDSLTGLANRAQMMQTLEQAVGGQNGLRPDCTMFLLDLDRFKEVNDTMGHPAGDALLRQLAQRLTRIVGTKGKVGRLGGDEFQIILPGMTEISQITRLAEEIIHSVSQPCAIESSQVVIGVSIGIAMAPDDGDCADTLIRNADLALYAAKADGRGLYRFFVPAMHSDAEDRRQLEADLRQAITSGDLHLEYQPVVCANSERITGFESLIRWAHPTRGSISPTIFIPIAEDAGLIGAIGEWVLRTACAEAMNWPVGTRVAVNVSPIQFANASLPNVVVNALVNAGLSADRLELEITESVFLADRDNTSSMFAQLKQIGVRLALDDFGTGYSALGYLKTAPFDKIKIDQSFVRGAAIKGSRNAAIVKSIVNLAEALGMETTAEGAETLDELDLIRTLGCSHIQGYVYGRSVPASEAIALLAENEGYALAQGHKSSRPVRMAMLRSVTLHQGGNSYAARIRNISETGTMIEGLLDVPAGTEFVIEFGKGHMARAICRWSRENRMGMEFVEAVNIERVRNPEHEGANSGPIDIPDFYRDRSNWKQAG